MVELLKKWDLFRWIRLIAGMAMLGYGASVVDWPLIILGIMLGWMAVSNTGCSPFNNSCEIDPKARQKDE